MNSDNTSNVLQIISHRENEVFFRNVSPDESLYTISNLSISVQVNDHLGIATRLVRSSLQVMDVGNESASDYYYGTGSSLSANFETMEGSPYIPLITAVISRKSFGGTSQYNSVLCEEVCLLGCPLSEEVHFLPYNIKYFAPAD